MTAVFSSWETDPFFAAATEVQESADRMELAYRNWLYKRALAGERTADERSVNHVSVSKGGQALPRSTPSSRQDVTVALDTTKWQLEEFEKAATDLAQRNASGLGEDVSQRHFSFIGAIQNQIGLIEDMLHKCMDTQCLNTSHLVKLNAEEREQLEVFLSGCSSFHPKKENSSSCTSSQAYAPVSGLKKSVDSRFMSSHYNSRVLGRSSCSKQHIGDGCKSELHSCSEVDKASSAPLERPNMIRSLQEGHCIAGLHGIGKLQSSTNGFRRWKKGLTHMDINKDSTFLWKDKPLPDIEEGVLPEISRSKRQSSLRSAVGWSLGQLAISCNEAACSSFRLQRAAVVVVVLCLCCMYFWFLSSLIPYVNNSFQD